MASSGWYLGASEVAAPRQRTTRDMGTRTPYKDRHGKELGADGGR
jgi:hypothetical protein